MEEKKLFYRGVLALVIPMALQNLVNVGITSTDVIMLGKVSEVVLSGASLGSQIQFIISLILFGLTSGASVLVAQYWGKGDVKTIEKVLGISLRISISIGLFFTIVTFLFPDKLMLIFTNEEAVIREGAIYLKNVCFNYLIISFVMVYLNILRSVERVKISTFVYLMGLIVNIIVNAILIFGLLGFPKLGIQGAAIGTVIAGIVELIIVIYYDRKVNNIFKLKFKYLIEKDKVIFKDFINYSLPVIINELMWGAGVSTMTAVLGHMGSPVIAANSVTQVIRQLATVVSFGIATSTAILIGKKIGEGNYKLAKVYGDRFLKLSIITGVIGSFVILITGFIAKSNLELSTEAASYFMVMIFIMAYFVIGQSINTTLIVGVFRAGGDTKFGLYLDVSVMWGISILCGALAAFVLKLPVGAVYMILLSDEIIKIPVTIWRFKSYKWIKNVTK